MKILFVEVNHEIDWAITSIGPAYIGAYLRQHGYQVEMIMIPLDMPVDEFTCKIQEKNADILAVSLTSRQWLRARELFNALRATLSIPVITGGLHPTYAAESVLKEPGFDYVCLSEGEQAMLEFVQSIESTGDIPATGIDNIQVKGGERPKLRPPFEPIDNLPYMARDLLHEQYNVVHISTQRGCPFPCTYCAARTTSELYEGSYATFGRRRSHQNVLDELSQIRDKQTVNYIVFLDDTFTINHSWVKKFCSEYKTQFNIPFSINARIETINQDLLRTLADAGCMHIIYGVESGSERVRTEILKRNISNKKIIYAFQWTQDAGIMATANYMLGIPGETADEIEQTLNLHKKIQPKDFGYFVFYPYQGTALFKQCMEKGYLPADFESQPANNRHSILNLPNLTNEQIDYYYEKFTETRIQDHIDLQPETINADFTDGITKEIRNNAVRG